MGSKSSSSNSTSTNVTTTNITDSYNRTYSKVANLSNVGNITVGDEVAKLLTSQGSASTAELIPGLPTASLVKGLLVIVGILIAVKLWRKFA